MTYQIVLTPAAAAQLANVTDRRIRGQIADRINGLATDPERQGKPLTGELRGLRSIRAAAQRYRIVFRVERDRVIVVILAVGIRREGDRADIYELAAKLVRVGLTRRR